MKVRLINSPKKDKKWRAIFYNNDGVFKRVDFGQKNAEDFTIHKDEARKRLYILRHKSRENWNDPYSAGALSKWILWNKPTLKESFNDYKSRFGFF